MHLSDGIRRMALDLGFWEAGFIATEQIHFSEEIRQICEGNVCRHYAKTWACPPAVGTVEACAARCRRFDTMLLLSGKYDLEDSFDYEGMIAGMRDFKHLMEKLDDAARARLGECLFLSNEGCGRCAACTYPDAPCRFPQRLHHAIEGYGLNVSELARQAGVRYVNGPNTVTYFGAVLMSEREEEAGAEQPGFVAPVKALGMQTVWIRQGPRRNCLPHTDGERAAWTVETLDGLLERF